MRFGKPLFCALLVGALLLSGCGADGGADSQDSAVRQASEANQAVTRLDKIDMTQWQYNEETDVYWQTGIVYCENPADEAYENLGIYVPGAYLTGTENGDGTYTCEINGAGTIGTFTADSAPIVIPVDTPGYAAMAAPTGYAASVSDYTDAGLIYVYAGCRGREAGAPSGVTDLKAAIRYVRYNGDTVPGSTDRIFTFGMSGGGAQSALLGATGDSALYTPYLEAIGAVSGVSDAVTGSMCWCPITNLDYANEAYEWNLGVTRTDLDAETQALSDAMAEQFALYINALGLTDAEGNPLTLEASEDGIYQAGSYYDYLKKVVETALNQFLADTSFPYTAASSQKQGAGGRFDELPDGELEQKGTFRGRDDGGKADFIKGDLEKPDFDTENDLYAEDGIHREKTDGGIRLSGTYETAQDYVDALNGETNWIAYDSETNTATITSIQDFVSAMKVASKDVGAFDALDESQGENILFGDGDGEGDHFDAVMAALLADSDYGSAFAEDLKRTDALGTSVEDRVNMYTPLYYLSAYYDGYQTANVAPYWRIRSGISQSDTALTTEVNLALALEAYGADVDFETVWGQGHVEAERTGSSTENFIDWVITCCS